MNNKGKILRPDPDKDGYLKFTLQSVNGKKLKRFSHRLVGMQFIPNPKHKKEINHIRVLKLENGDAKCFHDDNYYKNLEWSTRKENIKHSRKHKLQKPKYGDESKHSKFSVETVVFICQLMENGYTNKMIMKALGFKTYHDKNYEAYRGLVKHLRRRTSWTFVTDNFIY